MKFIELKIITFRFRQFFRFLKDIGWGYVLIMLLIAIPLAISVTKNVDKIDSYLLVGIYPLLVFLLHGRRKDFNFLKKIKIRLWLLYLIEYNILCIPLSVSLILNGMYITAAMAHGIVSISCYFLSVVKFSIGFKPNNWKLAIIPNVLFEWKSTIRKYNITLLVLWVLGLFMSLHEYAYFIFIFFFLAIISTAFQATEGKEIKPFSPEGLRRKISVNFVFLTVCLAPHFAVYMVFNHTYWYIILSVFIYLHLVQSYCILFKYSTYRQSRDAPNQVPTGVFMLYCPVIPLSIPVLLYTYLKARHRISHA